MKNAAVSIQAEITKSSSIKDERENCMDGKSVAGVPILADAPYIIHDKFAAKCFSLLLDAAEITSHPSSCTGMALGSIPGPALVSLARSTMEEFKRRKVVHRIL